jgi:hypothetical protein
MVVIKQFNLFDQTGDQFFTEPLMLNLHAIIFDKL